MLTTNFPALCVFKLIMSTFFYSSFLALPLHASPRSYPCPSPLESVFVCLLCPVCRMSCENESFHVMQCCIFMGFYGISIVYSRNYSLHCKCDEVLILWNGMEWNRFRIAIPILIQIAFSTPFLTPFLFCYLHCFYCGSLSKSPSARGILKFPINYWWNGMWNTCRPLLQFRNFPHGLELCFSCGNWLAISGRFISLLFLLNCRRGRFDSTHDVSYRYSPANSKQIIRRKTLFIPNWAGNRDGIAQASVNSIEYIK